MPEATAGVLYHAMKITRKAAAIPSATTIVVYYYSENLDASTNKPRVTIYYSYSDASNYKLMV